MKKKLLISLVLSVFLLLITSHFQYLKAQNEDFGSWTGIEIRKKFSQRLSASFAEEFRWKENVTQLDNLFSEAGIDYKLSKYLKISANYRFNQKQKRDQSFDTGHRLSSDFRFQNKIKAIIFNYRMRVQSQVNDYYSSETGKFPDYNLRHKFSLQWDLDNRISPFAATELFYPINQIRNNKLSRLRLITGIDYEINKESSMSINYLIQKETFVKNPLTEHVIQLNYQFSF